MKKLISILLSTIILSSVFSVCLSVSATTNSLETIDYGTTSDGWYYNICKEKNPDTDDYFCYAYITGYVGNKSEATFPTKVVAKSGTYNVTEAGPLLIKDNKYLKKLTIPDSANKIAHENGNSICFKGSSTLEEVTVGSAVKNIYSAMFCDCTKLKTVNFTKEFLAQKPYIGAGAFTRCTSLRKLVLPNGISDVSDDALAGCKNLNTITFGEDIKSCPITTDNVNLTNIKLLRKKSDVGFYSVNPGNGNHNCPINFNNSKVTVECYEGTLAAYDIANYYPTQGIKFSFTFKSLGKVDGDPYVPPTTEPPTTTAPYTVSVGEGDEWYIVGDFTSWSKQDSNKMTYNPANNTFEKTYTLNKGNYGFRVKSDKCPKDFGPNGAIDYADPIFDIITDNSTVKFVFDGIKVRMYINEQEATSTTLPPETSTSTTLPPETNTSTSTSPSSTVTSTSVTTSTTVPDTSVSETASVPSTPTRPTVTVGTLELEKTNDTLFVGKDREYKYTFTCNDLINHVEFVSDKNTVAQVNLNKDNTFTVVPLSKGEATITATLYDRDNREVTKSTFTVTVKQPVTKITIKAKNKVVNNNVINIKKVNGKAKLNVSVAPVNADNKRVTYTSSNSKVATVNSKGLITAKKVGFTNVTVKSNDGNFKTTVKVTVGNTASKIVINSYKNIAKVNSLAKINYSVYYRNKKTNLYSIKPTWKSYKTSVATVDKNGNVTAKKKGVCFIVATFNDGKTITSKKCLVIVGNRVSKVVKTNYKNTIVLRKNKSVTLKAEVKNNNATYKDCKWYLGKNKYVKISNVKNKGNKSHFYTQTKVTAKKKGTCYVYCKTKDGSNKQLRYKIIIK